MKKAIILLLILSLLIFPSCSPDEQSEFEGKKLSSTKMVDPEGNITKLWSYKYTPKGEISTSQRSNADGVCLQRNEYIYTDDGRVDGELVYLVGKKVRYIKYSYDEEGKKIAETTYVPDRSNETQFFYLEDGSLEREEIRDKDGNLLSSKKYLYDDAGNKIEEQNYGASSYLGGTKFTYEGKYPVIMEYTGNGSDEFSREIHTYDGENIVKKVFYDKSGNLIYTDLLEYDENGCSKQTRYDKNENIVYIWTSFYDDFITLIG